MPLYAYEVTYERDDPFDLREAEIIIVTDTPEQALVVANRQPDVGKTIGVKRLGPAKVHIDQDDR